MPSRPAPPAEEQAIGMRAYLTATPGTGGRLRSEPEDFQVIELADGPPRVEGGKHAAARIRLRNWETNRFCHQAANVLKVKRGAIGFAGMKDKRAVTEQWFTFPCPVDRLDDLERLADVEVLESHATRKANFAGAHEGNRFVLRIRDHAGASPDDVAATLATIASEGGVPNFFGPQRFGAVRPITHRVGRAIIDNDLEEAVRLYLGEPIQGEQEEAYAARQVYESTRDPVAALEVYPQRLDFETKMLGQLVKEPGDWRRCLKVLPHNLLQLFVHAHQSLVFNHIVSARIEAGLGLRTAHVGDLVMPSASDGRTVHAVTAKNQARIQQELDRGRAVITAPLPGLSCPRAQGRPGEVEAKVLADLDIDAASFRCRELPQVASDGLRRGILQAAQDLALTWQDGDPVVSFALGRGAYATVVVREVMKTTPDAY